VGKLYQVYVLQNQRGQFYIGLSENISARLEQHNNGVSKWTAKRGPWVLVWASSAVPLSEARRLEIHLKKQKAGAGFFAFTGLKKSSVS
jgi:predicted GIY-YIG superfamily endonuclease